MLIVWQIQKHSVFLQKSAQRRSSFRKIDFQSPFFVRKHNNEKMLPTQGNKSLFYFFPSYVSFYSSTFLLFCLYLISSIFTKS